MKIELNINSKVRTVDIKPNESLLDVLRKEGYKSVKYGCGEGECGSCTVLIDGIAVKSCIHLAVQASGHNILTVEGISKPDELHPLQDEFVATGGAQCGYCVPGMILSAKALLDENPNPNDQEIKKALDGNLCRCTGYTKQLEAVSNAAKKLRGEKND